MQGTMKMGGGGGGDKAVYFFLPEAVTLNLK